MQTEQQKAIRDFSSHAAQLHDFAAGGVRVHAGQGGKINCAGADGLCGGDEIRRAVACAQRCQILRCTDGELFRTGKRIQRLLFKRNRFAQQRAQTVYNARDARDVVALREDKGAQSFPRLLPQNADAAAKIGSGSGKCIYSKAVADGGIVCVAVKITAPELCKLLLVRGKHQRAVLIGNASG